MGKDNPSAVRILVADDHAIVREGLKRIIEETPDWVVAGEAADCEQALEQIRQKDWEVVLLDISMPGRGGLDLLLQLKRERPQLPILMLTVHPEDQYAARAFKSGANGYLTKKTAPHELVSAIRQVLAGRRYISPSFAERLVADLSSPTTEPRHKQLSDREYQVLCLIASGKTVSDIARDLLLSVKTVSTYRSNVLQKLALKNNAELIRYAIEHELVD